MKIFECLVLALTWLIGSIFVFPVIVKPNGALKRFCDSTKIPTTVKFIAAAFGGMIYMSVFFFFMVAGVKGFCVESLISGAKIAFYLFGAPCLVAALLDVLRIFPSEHLTGYAVFVYIGGYAISYFIHPALAGWRYVIGYVAALLLAALVTTVKKNMDLANENKMLQGQKSGENNGENQL